MEAITFMKLEDLAVLKEQFKKKYSLTGTESDQIRIVVGLATCGISAGAQPVYDYLAKAVEEKGINALVVPTGCIGICQFEPVFEVTMPGENKVTYINMNVEKAERVVEEHIIGGKVVEEFTIGAVQ